MLQEQNSHSQNREDNNPSNGESLSSFVKVTSLDIFNYNTNGNHRKQIQRHSHLKRKVFIEIDLHDNYRSQKRYVSESLAQQLKDLSISVVQDNPFEQRAPDHILSDSETLSLNSTIDEDGNLRFFDIYKRNSDVKKSKMFPELSLLDLPEDRTSHLKEAGSIICPVPFIFHPLKHLNDFTMFIPDNSKALIIYRPPLEVIFESITARDAKENLRRKEIEDFIYLESSINDLEQEMEEIDISDTDINLNPN